MKRPVATIRDVAEAAGVSIATVSAVLNESARVSPAREARVRTAVEALSYAPQRSARSLRQGKSMLLSLIVPDIANPFFGTVGRIVEREADKRGYSVLLSNSGEDIERERRHLTNARAHNADGLILSITGDWNRYDDTWRRHIGMPTVLVDRDIPGLDLECVTTDNALASELAVQHLLALGHRRIGAILGADTLSTARERAAGYHAALERSDADRDPSLAVHGDVDEEDARRSCAKLLARSPRPTAFFAANNAKAIGAIRAINAAGLRCPEDISLISVDDVDATAIMFPRLTSVTQPLETIGTRAIQRLLALLAGGMATMPRIERLKPRLIVGESCAGPAVRHR